MLAATRLIAASGRLSTNRQDWLIAAALVLLVAVTRIPFRTTMLYNWDSANFALAIDHFDVTRHFPHPPGYFYYVMLARGIRIVAQDANASLVAEGIVFSALAVVAVYHLGMLIFDRPTGVIAALLLTFSVTYWSLGTVALPYVSLAFFSAAMAFFAYRAVFSRKDETVPLSIVYAVGGGFRPDLMLFLGPLWGLAMIKKPPRRIAIGAMLVVVGFLLWYVPTVWLSGGIEGYHSTLLAYLQVDVAQKYAPTHKGLSALLVNVRDTLSYLFYALYFTVIPLLFGVACVAHRAVLARATKRHCAGVVDLELILFVACWILPMGIFYVFIHVGDPGYVFTILPALLLFAARALTLPLAPSSLRLRARPHPNPLPEGEGAGLSSRHSMTHVPLEEERTASPGAQATAYGYIPKCPHHQGDQPCSRTVSPQRAKKVILVVLLMALVLAGNISVATFYPRQLTLVGIRRSDEALRTKIEHIRNNLPSRSSLLVSYESYRHLQYYLPQHNSVWIDIFDPREQTAGISPEIERVALVDERLQQLGLQDKASQHAAGIQLVPIGKEERREREIVYAQHRLVLR